MFIHFTASTAHWHLLLNIKSYSGCWLKISLRSINVNSIQKYIIHFNADLASSYRIINLHRCMSLSYLLCHVHEHTYIWRAIPKSIIKQTGSCGNKISSHSEICMIATYAINDIHYYVITFKSIILVYVYLFSSRIWINFQIIET